MLEYQARSRTRFQFGKNWTSFLRVLTDERIRLAEEALTDVLGMQDLTGKTFLDIGSGSGLSSLVARRLGARVTSFDLDPASVACTDALRMRYFPDDPSWRVLTGSALDASFLAELGQFDVVYSWGVLHHTGDMWRALDLVTRSVAPGGRLFIAIYNDQGWKSAVWRRIKQTYCSSMLGKAAVCTAFVPFYGVMGALQDLRSGRNPLTRYRTPTTRGMSIVHDWFDWLGGLPFEVASPERLIAFLRERELSLVTERRTASLGCNQLVFHR